MKNSYTTNFSLESLKGKHLSEDQSVDGRIIFKWISGKLVERVRILFIWLRIGTVAESCEHGNEPSGSIKRQGIS
jgi:hypothetical protein